jgi:glycosyltransferase involved in cell wall biosynthesis
MMRVAMLAPPWIPVPAPDYGGIEEVVRLLSRGLVARGHDVTLFAAPGSESDAVVVEVLDEAQPDNIEDSLIEATYVGAVFDRIDAARRAGKPFDVIHDHCPAVALAMADRLPEPFVHTLHGPFADDRIELYRSQGHKATLVAISATQQALAPGGVLCRFVVPNPIELDEWAYSGAEGDGLIFVGRMDPDKGPDRAITAAKLAGEKLTLAGPIQPDHEEYFASEVEPHIDGEQIRYIGPVAGAEKHDLFAGAAALLMPIEWDEPFGLVMVEANAVGTPVIAFGRGAATEIVRDGENGYLVGSVEEMADAIHKLADIERAACRESVASRFSVDRVCDGYELAYNDAITRMRSTRT